MIHQQLILASSHLISFKHLCLEVIIVYIGLYISKAGRRVYYNLVWPESGIFFEFSRSNIS